MLSKDKSIGVESTVSLLMVKPLALECFCPKRMMVVLTGFAKNVNNLSFNTAIMQRKDIDASLLKAIFCVNLAACGLTTLDAIFAAHATDLNSRRYLWTRDIQHLLGLALRTDTAFQRSDHKLKKFLV